MVKPKYKNIILKSLVNVQEDGSFKLNQKYFSYSTHLVMTNKNFDDLFYNIQRKKDPITQAYGYCCFYSVSNRRYYDFNL